MKNILFAASEYGSFNMIYPILKACLGKYGVGYIGIKPISDDGLMFKKVTDRTASLGRSLLKDFDIFVTGSTARLDTEYLLWKQAAGMKKRSVCVLDQHKHVDERFTRNGKRMIPDSICVMNDDARNALLGLGIHKKKVFVTGSPYLAGISRLKTGNAARKEMREKMSVGNKKVVTFCTEYIIKAGQRDKYGYDEYLILDDIIAQLRGLGGYDFRLYIRLHPNDSKALYRRYAWKTLGNVEVKVAPNDPEYKMLQMSDIVVGMDSIILVVSAMLGIPVISYQPLKDAKKAFIYDEVIAGSLATDRESFRCRLQKILAGRDSSKTGKRRLSDPVGKVLKIIEKGSDA